MELEFHADLDFAIKLLCVCLLVDGHVLHLKRHSAYSVGSQDTASEAPF